MYIPEKDCFPFDMPHSHVIKIQIPSESLERKGAPAAGPDITVIPRAGPGPAAVAGGSHCLSVGAAALLARVASPLASPAAAESDDCHGLGPSESGDS